jgi:monofunctional biosynthetic peptidoglycan transglycosylase
VSVSRALSARRAARKSGGYVWLRRIVVAVLAIVVVAPVGLVLLFRFVPPPTTPLIFGTRLAGEPVHQRWVPLDKISANFVKAVIASEDQKFCSHHGFDLEAIDKALDSNARGGRLRGASTISQQTAKNLFLPPNRTWTRKGIEAYFTVLLEAFWPKSRIIEAYLNVIELGKGNFGAEAAAEAYFHSSAAKLTRAEAARLAAVLPDPKQYSVLAPGPYVARRTGEIMGQMAVVTRDGLDSCVTHYGR